MTENKSMKPASILKKYFGLKDGQDNASFIVEMRELKGSEEDFTELTTLAAQELGVTPDFSE